jgi:multidrug resistance protein, MATE family
MQPEARPAGAFDVTHRMVLGLALPMTLGFLTIPLLGITDTAVAGRPTHVDAILWPKPLRQQV